MCCNKKLMTHSDKLSINFLSLFLSLKKFTATNVIQYHGLSGIVQSHNEQDDGPEIMNLNVNKKMSFLQPSFIISYTHSSFMNNAYFSAMRSLCSFLSMLLIQLPIVGRKRENRNPIFPVS